MKKNPSYVFNNDSFLRYGGLCADGHKYDHPIYHDDPIGHDNHIIRDDHDQHHTDYKYNHHHNDTYDDSDHNHHHYHHDSDCDYEAVQTITFFSINDLHGTAYSDLQSFSRMAKYLYDRNQNQENTIVLASGDMFQGTAFSNYYYGRPLVEIMNHVGFDSFTLGNHEFDWGIDKIAAYRDGISENGEMVFPVLAANIVSKSTGEPFPWA
jgi:hypothetical protein